MSYAQAMKWHKKHPRGGKAQYMGFDTSSAPVIKTEAEMRLFHQNKYLPFHLKNNSDKDMVQTEDDYVKSYTECQEREIKKWNEHK